MFNVNYKIKFIIFIDYQNIFKNIKKRDIYIYVFFFFFSVIVYKLNLY